MPMAIVARRRLTLVPCAAIVVLAGAHCSEGASATADDTWVPNSDGGDGGTSADTDAKPDRGGSEGGASADSGSGSDSGGGTLECAPTCSGATPVCDRGVCKACTSTAGCSA